MDLQPEDPEFDDSCAGLEIFSEEPFRRRDLGVCRNREGQGGLQKSEEGLAETSSLDKEKEAEVDQLAEVAPDHEVITAEVASSSAARVTKNSQLPFTHAEIPEDQTILGIDCQDRHPDTQTTNGIELLEKPISKDKDLDTYCITCCVPMKAIDQQSNKHNEHEVMPFVNVIEIAKDELRRNICKLEDQITHLENFSGHLEEIFITVEENFGKQEQDCERQYNDLVWLLEQRHDESMQSLGEEKKEKLEALYEKLVNCGENLDTCKELIETIEDLGQGKDKADTIKTAVATVQRLDEFLKKDVDVELSTPAEFEDRVTDFSSAQELMDCINAVPDPSPPCAPVMNSQNPNSATGTSVRVCWSFFSEDTVESYQLHYKRVSNDTSKEEQDELMLNVKETYCTVADLAPNTQYEFWARAFNSAGGGPESERAVYLTAPLPPTIRSKEIQSCEHAALVCWASGNTNPVDSYTVELSRLTDGEDEDVITESIVGIPNFETLIQLQPRHQYSLSVKALNMGGASERSEPVSICSTGTYFTLNEETAHPFLSIQEDGFKIACHKTESPRSDLFFHKNSFTRSIAILGHQIPFRGKHYWEVDVDENTEYRIGVTFKNVSRDKYLGESHDAWCMRHTVAHSRHTYEFLNDGTTPDIKITVPPQRIGLLLNYDDGTLSFFNADIMQHLYTFHSGFQDFVCPCFAQEEPGILGVRNGITMPTFAISLVASQ